MFCKFDTETNTLTAGPQAEAGDDTWVPFFSCTGSSAFARLNFSLGRRGGRCSSGGRCGVRSSNK